MAAGVQGCPAAKGAMGCTAAKGWMGCATPTCQCGPCELTLGGTFEFNPPTFEADSGAFNICNEFLPEIDAVSRLLAKLAQLPAALTFTITSVDNCSGQMSIAYTGGGLIDGVAPTVTNGLAVWSGDEDVEGCDDYVLRWCVLIYLDVVCSGDDIEVTIQVGGRYSICAPEAGGPCGNGSCAVGVLATDSFSVSDCSEPTDFTYAAGGTAFTCTDCTGGGAEPTNDGTIVIDNAAGVFTVSA